jgi:hypothetical protein
MPTPEEVKQARMLAVIGGCLFLIGVVLLLLNLGVTL